MSAKRQPDRDGAMSSEKKLQPEITEAANKSNGSLFWMDMMQWAVDNPSMMEKTVNFANDKNKKVHSGLKEK